MTQVDRPQERLIETYRKKAKHYDVTSRLYPAPGYPQRAQRIQAVRALGLRPGDTVVDLACGTGLNFRLLEYFFEGAECLDVLVFTPDMFELLRIRIAHCRQCTLVSEVPDQVFTPVSATYNRYLR